MNLDFGVKKMDTTFVSSSQELCKFQVYNSSPMIEKSHQNINFQSEIVEGDSSCHDTTKVTKGQPGGQGISCPCRVKGRAAPKRCDKTKVAIAKKWLN